MSVYSTQFLVYNYDSDPDEYVVPDGYIAILRDITGVTNGSEPDALHVSIDGVGVISVVGGPTTDVGNAPMQWSGRVVVNSGQTITVQSAQTDCSAVVSGYLLSV